MGSGTPLATSAISSARLGWRRPDGQTARRVDGEPEIESTRIDWAAASPALADQWPGQADDGLALAERLPLYVVVEKILEPGEPLPNDWAVHGTVGYEF